MNRTTVVATAQLLLLTVLGGFAACQNIIDAKRPILRDVSGLQDGALFGYSLVLHQTLSNASDMTESLSGVR